MKLLLACAAASAALIIAPLAQAQTQTAPAATAAAADARLYNDLGGQPGLTRLVDRFWDDLKADARMAPFFVDVNATQFKARLTEQFCEVSGGPCTYTGADMKTAHAGIDVTRADFNALVEVLQRSMDAQGIGFTVQNRLLARLAPMHRDVVNVR
jgi:hemoglobin